MQWHEGVIVLHDNQVLAGKLNVEQVHDVVLFRHRDSLNVTVLPAFKVKAVNYYDVASNINRRFISLDQQSAARTTYLYEVVVTGTVRVLRRLNTYHSVPPNDDEYMYYSMKNDELVELKKFGGTMFTHLDDLSGHRLSVYVRAKRFDPYQLADAIRIIQYFNSLEIPAGVLSRK
ncbi:MAG: hypothetical protein KIT51_02220 [Cyclobacteriaceae bacterium]|nr:MAG: hypothetical protein KIT51_02220 [Cyclobacteriaceae bacterium]